MNGDKPAFPVTKIETDMSYDREVDQHFPRSYTYDEDGGLTKREMFAAMAMQGSLGGVPGSHLVPPNLAKMSVEYADALLAELSKTTPFGNCSHD